MKKCITLIVISSILCMTLTSCEKSYISGSFDDNNNYKTNKIDAKEEISYNSLTEYTEDADIANESYNSTGKDENSIHIFDSATVCLNNVSITRDSDNSEGGDSASFYGIGSALLVTDGTAYVSESKINTNAKGGAGIFSYGNSTVNVSNTTVSTKKDTSGGIHVAGGGQINAWNLNIETKGESSAAIRSDRGGGTIVIDGGVYVTNGTGSPSIYSTADIIANSAELTANSSEAICIEGLNSVYLYDCNLSGNMHDNSQNDTTWNIILYQSMSGDSVEGNSTFEMVGGTLKASNGGMFYTTNTQSTFLLSSVSIDYSEDNDFFLQCTGNTNKRGWGTLGQNGAQCNFTAINQKMDGNIIWDSISELDFYISDNSILTGAFIDNETWSVERGTGYCNVYIDSDSKWIITDNSTITNLYSKGKITDVNGNDVSIIDVNGNILVEGNSLFSITVLNFESNVDISGASKLKTWEYFKVSKPSQLS